MPRDGRGKPGSTDTDTLTTLELEGTGGKQGVYDIEGNFRYVQVTDANPSWPYEDRATVDGDSFDFDGDGDGEFVVWTDGDGTHEFLLIELKGKVKLDSFDVSSFEVTGLDGGESGTVNGYDKDGTLLYTETFFSTDLSGGTYEIAQANIDDFDIYQFNIVAEDGSTFYIDDIVFV